jgi:uncharacterized protein YbcI
MNQQIPHFHQHIASFMGKLLRDHFGKGPESVFVTVVHTFITIYLRNFLTPSEKVLLEQNHDMILHQMREQLMQLMIPEISSYIQIMSGIKPTEIYYDWDLGHKTGMLVAICPEPLPVGLSVNETYHGKKEIEEEIISISRQIQKAPERIYSCEINSRSLLIVRQGILLRLEKELIRLGHGELLKGIKRNLEKSHFHQDSFEAVLNRRVVDCFVDWNYDLDKSVVLLILDTAK